MTGDKEETHQQTDKPNLTTTTAIRLLLDRAANVNEAIALLQQYDMNSSIGSAPGSSIFVLRPFLHTPDLPKRWMFGICWNLWRRKTIPRQRAAMKRPCGASCIARKADALISTIKVYK